MIGRLQRNIMITPGKHRNSRAVEYWSCTEACKQMQKGSGNKSGLLFLVLKCEIVSTIGSLNREIICIANLTLQSTRQEL